MRTIRLEVYGDPDRDHGSVDMYDVSEALYEALLRIVQDGHVIGRRRLEERLVGPEPLTGETQKAKVLELLERAGSSGVTTTEFLEHRLPRFGARIKELRDEGHEIETSPIEGKAITRYTLILLSAAELRRRTKASREARENGDPLGDRAAAARTMPTLEDVAGRGTGGRLF